MKRQRNTRARRNYLLWMKWYRFRSKEQAFPYGQRGVSKSKMKDLYIEFEGLDKLLTFRKVR